MAAIPGVRVTGTIVPTDTTDVYPATDPQYGIDGWRSVADAATRNAIPDARRREGMVVAQQDTDQNFQLKAPPWIHTNADWNVLTSSPAGADKEVQFNDVGAFGADSGFTFDKATGVLTAPALVIGNSGISFDALAAATIAVNTNDFSLGGRNSMRINCTVASNLTGIDSTAFAATPFPLFLYNSGAAVLTLKNNDAGSAAGNRFLFDADLALPPNNGCVLMYDPTSLGWRLVGKSTGATGTEVRKVKTVVFADSPYTLLATDCQVNVDCSGGNIVINVPTATSVKDGTNDRVYHLKRLSNTPANSLTVNRSGGDVFDTVGNGAAVTSFTMGPGDAFELCGDFTHNLYTVS
jgi:hypothetical protein